MAGDLTLPQRLRVYAATLADGDTAQVALGVNELRALALLLEQLDGDGGLARKLEAKERVIDALEKKYALEIQATRDARARWQKSEKLTLAVLPLQLAIFLLIWWIS